MLHSCSAQFPSSHHIVCVDLSSKVWGHSEKSVFLKERSIWSGWLCRQVLLMEYRRTVDVQCRDQPVITLPFCMFILSELRKLGPVWPVVYHQFRFWYGTNGNCGLLSGFFFSWYSTFPRMLRTELIDCILIYLGKTSAWTLKWGTGRASSSSAAFLVSQLVCSGFDVALRGQTGHFWFSKRQLAWTFLSFLLFTLDTHWPYE